MAAIPMTVSAQRRRQAKEDAEPVVNPSDQQFYKTRSEWRAELRAHGGNSIDDFARFAAEYAGRPDDPPWRLTVDQDHSKPDANILVMRSRYLTDAAVALLRAQGNRAHL